MATNDLIVALDAAVGRARGSTGARRKALLPYVLSHGTALAGERDDLLARLDRGWVWLNEHPDESDEASRWIDLLHDYESASDALMRAEECL